MFVNTLILVVAVAVVSGQGSQLEQDCHILQSLDDVISRLDSAESDVTNLKSSLINAETQVTNLKTTLANTETQVANVKTSLTTAETDITSLKVSLTSADTKIDQQAAEITSLKVSLTSADTKIDQQAAEITSLKVSLTLADNKIDQQATHIETVQDSLTTAETEISILKDALATAETVIENLINSQTESSQPTNVLFHVRDIAAQPTENNAILFQTVVENLGDAYNITTGCFTAPIGGAYWFSSQICTLPTRYLYPSLFIRGNLASRVYVRDSNIVSCGSVTAVATLEMGDTACLKSGPVQNTDPVWNQLGFNTNNFMAAIIN